MSEPLEDVQDEILTKLHAGEDVDRDVVVAANPEHAEALREFFRVLDVIETASPAEAAMPASLGEFRVLRELGRGGMGVVYEAEQTSLKRRVALKVLPPALRTDPRLVMRFRREAEAAGKLRHPGIVPVYFVGEAAGAPFFAMEMVEGRSLDAILQDLRDGKDAGLPSAGDERRGWAVETIAKVADALDYAHGRGILHRDVKPANVIVDADGAPRLTDFGLALDAAAPGLTMAGEVFGSLHYMSPEQAVRRESPVDARTDVYSLAVTLYEALTLRLPYEGSTSAELLTALTMGKLTPARDVDPSIPPALERVVMRAMSRDPAQRPPSAAAFAADLRAAMSGAPTSPACAPPRRPRRTRVAVAAAATLVAAATVFFVGRDLGWWRAEEKRPFDALSDDDLQRIADGAPDGEESLRKSIQFETLGPPFISRKADRGRFSGAAMWESRHTGRLRAPIVLLLSWEVSLDAAPWRHFEGDTCTIGFSPPTKPRPADEEGTTGTQMIGSSISVRKLLGPDDARTSTRVRCRATLRVAPRPADRPEPTTLESLKGGTTITWTSDETTYLVYDDYPPDYPTVVTRPDVDEAMRKAVTPDVIEFGGLQVGSLGGGKRALPFWVRWTSPDGPVPAACDVELYVPGKETPIGRTTWSRSPGKSESSNTSVTMIFELAATPTPDEQRLLLDLQSGAQKTLRLVFRPSREQALETPSFASYWGGTADVVVPVTKPAKDE